MQISSSEDKSRVQRINLVMTRFSLAADASQSTNHIYVITNSRNQIEAYVCDNKFRIQIHAYICVIQEFKYKLCKRKIRNSRTGRLEGKLAARQRNEREDYYKTLNSDRGQK